MGDVKKHIVESIAAIRLPAELRGEIPAHETVRVTVEILPPAADALPPQRDWKKIASDAAASGLMRGRSEDFLEFRRSFREGFAVDRRDRP